MTKCIDWTETRAEFDKKTEKKNTIGVAGGVVTFKRIFKAQKGKSVIKKLYNILPRNALLTIFKSFL